MTSRKQKRPTGRKVKTGSPIQAPSVRQRQSTSGYSISELITIAAALVSLPAVLIYLIVVGVIVTWPISLQGNVMAPLLLGCIGLGLILLTTAGIAAGIWRLLKPQMIVPAVRFCIWANSLLLVILLLCVLLMPQLE